MVKTLAFRRSTYTSIERRKNKGRFHDKQDYYSLLDSVFGDCANLMAPQATVFVRTDKRDFALNSTLEVLHNHFPNYRFNVEDKPFLKQIQTELYGDKSKKQTKLI